MCNLCNWILLWCSHWHIPLRIIIAYSLFKSVSFYILNSMLLIYKTSNVYSGIGIILQMCFRQNKLVKNIFCLRYIFPCLYWWCKLLPGLTSYCIKFYNFICYVNSCCAYTIPTTVSSYWISFGVESLWIMHIHNFYYRWWKRIRIRTSPGQKARFRIFCLYFATLLKKEVEGI